ncbi:transporter (plasmid) [Pacificitalea manganoxidans]|uniref:Transporter n=1 Tax=Pacificitalea manganoxidans TaxID=1411902 RepID=A0A291M4F4_9RHOB|nr:tripartite tricarboxylate transporter substrate binding protein [Pacificitalea manganoxidans]ATI43625.1 transporter [Pacificitalea manganoxidans]MDR6309936.1 putative tricarboxylic transport membrane protein [Pacificitalea manganoxidans]|tara:strand:- start:800 stop:1786 length:987 start_codon:yes stop_codon:yes gene_type:complete
MTSITTRTGGGLRLAGLAAGCALGLAFAAPALAQDYPTEDLDWTIAFGPGGGNDIMARTMVDIIQKYDLYGEDIRVENRAGGSGAVGWGYLYSKAGDGYNISTTSGSLITTPLQADTPWSPSDFVPIALLATDDLAIMVGGESEWDTIEDFIAAAKETPPTLAGTGTVNVDFIVPTLFAEKAGFEFEYVSFNSMADMQTALLSGAVDAMVGNPGEIVGLVESGDMKALVYSGETTPPALGDVPTMDEKGWGVGVSMPRGVILAPDAPQEAVDFWIETVKKIVDTPEWDKYIETNLLTENIKYGDEFGTFLQNTQDGFEKVLRAQGAID